MHDRCAKIGKDHRRCGTSNVLPKSTTFMPERGRSERRMFISLPLEIGCMLKQGIAKLFDRSVRAMST
ncbi:hypothetical protein [Mesorhizobium sp. L48C026A00]|uniref:hypothetical protein n=1 Tax=Mesorhizobium sp. L48C026A00 TaxID=1287182 RepID=UPI0024752ACA|nr:hypothetical protein [Mesorhizobium sp. L48C026A00]